MIFCSGYFGDYRVGCEMPGTLRKFHRKVVGNMLDIKGGGSGKSDNYEGRKLTHDIEPIYCGTREYYVSHTEEVLLKDELFYGGTEPDMP